MVLGVGELDADSGVDVGELVPVGVSVGVTDLEAVGVCVRVGEAVGDVVVVLSPSRRRACGADSIYGAMSEGKDVATDRAHRGNAVPSPKIGFTEQPSGVA